MHELRPADGAGSCVGFCTGSQADPMCPEGVSVTSATAGPCRCASPAVTPWRRTVPTGELFAELHDARLRLRIGCFGRADALRKRVRLCECVQPGTGVPQWLGRSCRRLHRSGLLHAQCDLGAANTCPGAGQTCSALFDPAPMGYEHVGCAQSRRVRATRRWSLRRRRSECRSVRARTLRPRRRR